MCYPVRGDNGFCGIPRFSVRFTCVLASVRPFYLDRGSGGKSPLKKIRQKGGIIGTWIICALLLIIVIVEVCRDLSLPKPPKDSIINLWGLGSFLISLIVLPPVFSAVILNSAALIMQKFPAKSNTVLHGERAVGLAAKLILGLAGYTVALLLLMFL